MSAPGLRVDALCRHTLDHLLALVRVWTPADGVVYANRCWRELTGTTLEDNLGDGWLRAVHDDDRCAVATAQRSSPARLSTEYRMKASDGRAVHVRDVAAPWIDETTHDVIGLVHTITLQASCPQPDPEPLSRWAHELRGPLNAILGWSDLLAAGENDPDVVRRGLQAIASNARHQAQVIKRMTL
jgi:PAS domain S-box-containing protein